MECLRQIEPQEWRNIAILRQFVDDLPTNPYCTNLKGFMSIRTKNQAIRHRFIQPNHPAVCKWITLDVDDSDALFKFIDEFGLPSPQIIVRNPKNGHAHYAFRLTTPVGIGGKSSIKAMRYLAAVQHALAVAFGADLGYSGNLIKNPCYVKDNAPRDQLPVWIDEDEYEQSGERDEHETYIVRGVQPSYTLAELAEHLDLEPYKKADAVNDSGYGRNCTLFDELRHIAYKLPDKSYRAIVGELKGISDVINNRFDVPLLPNEVKHIISSIGRYCSRMDFTESHKAFSKLQSIRGAKGGTAKGKAYEEQKQLAIELYEKGMKKKDIAEKVGVTARTLTNWGLRKKK